jgi:large subunit ribosomal protein L6
MSTERTIAVPDDVTASIDHLDVTVEGPNGSVTRRLWYPNISVDIEDGDIVIASEESDAKTNATVGTFTSHVQNMVQGVTDGWEYEMEVFYSHFPMQVSVQDGTVVIENFIGEREPRRVPIHGDTQVSVDGEELTVSGPSIEDVGQTAADIEQRTRVSGKDTRVFQDGVYITSEPERGNA